MGGKGGGGGREGGGKVGGGRGGGEEYRLQRVRIGTDYIRMWG